MHAFTLYKNKIRSWVFNRSGPYSLTTFDIYKELERFIYTIIVYIIISDEELGLNTFIKRDNSDRFITVIEDIIGQERILLLEPVPIAY